MTLLVIEHCTWLEIVHKYKSNIDVLSYHKKMDVKKACVQEEKIIEETGVHI